jgi:hypothetical protein
MSAREHPFGSEPVLVGREAARAILGVTETTFARLCREARFENMVCQGGPALYRSAELRAYRAQDARRGASPRSVTNAAGEPCKSAGVRVTSETKNAAGARERSGASNHTSALCEGCRRPFSPRRAGTRSCSAKCRQRAHRRAAACVA